MPDRELIHAELDVSSMLLFAIDSGFQVLDDEPTKKQTPHILSRNEAESAKRGQFHLFRDEWIFGELQIMPITERYRVCFFHFMPLTNFSSIFVSFNGEWCDNNKLRFGGSVISLHKDWLEMPALIVRPYPKAAREWYTRFANNISSDVVI